MKDEIDHQIKVVQTQMICQVRNEILKEKVQEGLLQIIMNTIIVLIITIIVDNIKMKEDLDEKPLQQEQDGEEVLIVIQIKDKEIGVDHVHHQEKEITRNLIVEEINTEIVIIKMNEVEDNIDIKAVQEVNLLILKLKQKKRNISKNEQKMIIVVKREMNLELSQNAGNNVKEREMNEGEQQLVKFFQSSYKNKENHQIQEKKFIKQTISSFNTN